MRDVRKTGSLKKPFRMTYAGSTCGIVPAFLLLWSGTTVGAGALRFDFGGSVVASNHVAVDAETRFSEQRGYGWLHASDLEVRDRTTPAGSRRDFVMGVDPATFRVAGLDPGKYLLTVVSGDMDYGDHVTRVNVSGNGIDWPVLAPSVSEFATLTATINAGKSVDIVFEKGGHNWVVNALTLEPATEDQRPAVTLKEVPFEGWLAAAPNELGSIEPSEPAYLPEIRFHLTARAWQPQKTPRSECLDQMDQAVHALAPFQYWNENDPNDVKNGAIIDPYDRTEIQYGTPTFAFNVATLMTEGRAGDLAEPAARALDRASLNISTGYANQGHGEFFCAPMAKAIRMLAALQTDYPDVITPERLKFWKESMKTKRSDFMYLRVRQNWRTFAMKGEWLRQADGYITDGVDWIEKNWTSWFEGGQRIRFRLDLDKYHLHPYFFLYHDNLPNPPASRNGGPSYTGADPQTFTYNAAAAANLLDMLENGYNGPSADEMEEVIGRAMRSSLLLMSGSGEAPAGGRTGEHCWDDTIYANAFQDAANAALRKGDLRLAGEYRHAVLLLLKSHARFQHENGLFSITKNLFPASLKNHYATWSGVANYENFDLGCLAETLLADKTNIAEQPTPSEIGGFVVQPDPTFSAVFLNAGGMQAQICTRGETDNYGLVQWHTFGITRFSRMGWEGRLGPGAGGVNNDFSDGVSFSPTFLENGKWTRVCLQPKRFQGRFHTEFVHPLLVRGTYTIAPVEGQSGPTFEMHLTLTPDGALVDTERVSGTNRFGVVWPLFAFDGRTVLNKTVGHSIASTAYPRMDGKASAVRAEQAVASGGAVIADNEPAYEGTGFARLTTNGATLEWTGLNGGHGGATTIGLRYALGADKEAMRRVKLYVNGVAQPELRLLSTGDWKFWHQLYVPVTLARGENNTVRIESADQGGEVVEELSVYPTVPSSPEPDQQNFIALKATQQLDTSSPAVRTGYGDYTPVRVTDSEDGTVETFVYPRSAGDPRPEIVRASFVRQGQDFSSVLGRVQGTLYAGRTSAGGKGQAIDLDDDGRSDVSFSRKCAFILQLKDGKVVAVEADQKVKANIAGKEWLLAPFTPKLIE